LSIEPIHNERELLRQVAKGDEAAFRILFDAYRNRLYFYILRITASKEAAEDVLQNTFLKLWLNRQELDGVQNFNAWLFRISQNDVMNSLRRRALEATILQRELARPVPGMEAGELLHYKQVREIIQKAVDTLPPQQKKVYILRREEGLKIKEIAHTLDISPLTAKKHLTAAQKTIRVALDGFFRGEGAVLLFILSLLHQ
jgi:RNA polymerase sigma-70 factor (family 1)